MNLKKPHSLRGVFDNKKGELFLRTAVYNSPIVPAR
jgi:hypothetical protein